MLKEDGPNKPKVKNRNERLNHETDPWKTLKNETDENAEIKFVYEMSSAWRWWIETEFY